MIMLSSSMSQQSPLEQKFPIRLWVFLKMQNWIILKRLFRHTLFVNRFSIMLAHTKDTQGYLPAELQLEAKLFLSLTALYFTDRALILSHSSIIFSIDITEILLQDSVARLNRALPIKLKCM